MSDASPNSRRGFLASAAAGTAGVLAGVAWSPRSSSASASDSSEDAAPEAAVDAGAPTDADIGFLADMTAHHVQALVMCERVLGRDTGDEVQGAATEVLRNQAIEVGTMRAWLADWGQSTATPAMTMGWMGMNDGEGMPLAMMPGYASDDDLLELSLATGRSQGRWWLELMRAHHVGGVAMADAAVELASSDKVIRLAGVQSEVQTFEIGQYDQLLATTYS